MEKTFAFTNLQPRKKCPLLWQLLKEFKYSNSLQIWVAV